MNEFMNGENKTFMSAVPIEANSKKAIYGLVLLMTRLIIKPIKQKKM